MREVRIETDSLSADQISDALCIVPAGDITLRIARDSWVIFARDQGTEDKLVFERFSDSALAYKRKVELWHMLSDGIPAQLGTTEISVNSTGFATRDCRDYRDNPIPAPLENGDRTGHSLRGIADELMKVVAKQLVPGEPGYAPYERSRAEPKPQ